jgi:hypothetical protein
MQNIAKAINHIVFNKHESMLRNKGSEESLKELHMLEEKVSALINEGFIKDYDSLLRYLRQLWINKYNPISVK